MSVPMPPPTTESTGPKSWAVSPLSTAPNSLDELMNTRSTALTRQPLDPLSVSELDDRIATLEAEIDRVKAHRAAATSHKAIADALFKKG